MLVVNVMVRTSNDPFRRHARTCGMQMGPRGFFETRHGRHARYRSMMPSLMWSLVRALHNPLQGTSPCGKVGMTRTSLIHGQRTLACVCVYMHHPLAETYVCQGMVRACRTSVHDASLFHIGMVDVEIASLRSVELTWRL